MKVKTENATRNIDIILDNDVHTLMYDHQHQTVRHTLKQFNRAEQWKSLLIAGIDTFKKYNATKWLSDNRQGTVIPSEMYDWIDTYWLQEMLKAGWKKWAVVQVDTVIGKMSMKKFVEKFQAYNVEVRVFSSLEEAENWI